MANWFNEEYDQNNTKNQIIYVTEEWGGKDLHLEYRINGQTHQITITNNQITVFHPCEAEVDTHAVNCTVINF